MKDFSITKSSSPAQSSNEFQICISSCILTSHLGWQTNPQSAFLKLTPLSGCLSHLIILLYPNSLQVTQIRNLKAMWNLFNQSHPVILSYEATAHIYFQSIPLSWCFLHLQNIHQLAFLISLLAGLLLPGIFSSYLPYLILPESYFCNITLAMKLLCYFAEKSVPLRFEPRSFEVLVFA